MVRGCVFAASVGPPPRAGYDLPVTRAPEENLRSAPAGALIGKLPQGFLLNKVVEGTSGRWIHVTRAGWLEKTDLESVAQVASSRTAVPDSDTTQARPTPARKSGDPPTPGRGPGVGPPDTTSSPRLAGRGRDRKSTRLNSSHEWISYAVFCLKKTKPSGTGVDVI